MSNFYNNHIATSQALQFNQSQAWCWSDLLATRLRRYDVIIVEPVCGVRNHYSNEVNTDIACLYICMERRRDPDGDICNFIKRCILEKQSREKAWENWQEGIWWRYQRYECKCCFKNTIILASSINNKCSIGNIRRIRLKWNIR